MPNRDGTGPIGDGRTFGRGMGDCANFPQGLRQGMGRRQMNCCGCGKRGGRSSGQGFGNGRGFGQGQNMNKADNTD